MLADAALDELADRTVRRLALEELVVRGRRDEAVRRALEDPDAGLRACAPALAAPDLPEDTLF